MNTQSARRSVDLRRNVRHNRRARFWTGVICIVTFAGLSLLAYAEMDRIIVPERKVAVAPPPPAPSAPHKGTGHLVWVDSDGCTVGNFDNFSGQLGVQQSVPCSQVKNMSARHHQSPQNRFKKFNTGFQK
jgi:hypothetical protein